MQTGSYDTPASTHPTPPPPTHRVYSPHRSQCNPLKTYVRSNFFLLKLPNYPPIQTESRSSYTYHPIPSHPILSYHIIFPVLFCSLLKTCWSWPKHWFHHPPMDHELQFDKHLYRVIGQVWCDGCREFLSVPMYASEGSFLLGASLGWWVQIGNISLSAC